jgi:chromate transport protein ChrA
MSREPERSTDSKATILARCAGLPGAAAALFGLCLVPVVLVLVMAYFGCCRSAAAMRCFLTHLQAVKGHHWMTDSQFADIFSTSQTAPAPRGVVDVPSRCSGRRRRSRSFGTPWRRGSPR